MPRYAFTDLPTSVHFSLIAATSAEAEALAEQLGHEAHDLASLKRLGVRIEEVTFGDPSDIELSESDTDDNPSSDGA
ncbi:hypothetical protein ACFW6N_22850 [Streptomyces cyaneofuscatus]|uniref:hypothetical protein n=1 Tax=Streptomyces cyaneofuscatus TaxID=66883 RepID=UPI003692A476